MNNLISHATITSSKAIAGLLSVVALVTVVSYISILNKVVASIEIDDDGERRWDGREAEEYGVLVFAAVFMTIGMAFLVAVGFKTFRAPTGFQVGVLGGSAAMYANMALLCCFYFINFEPQEGEDRRQLENNNDDYNDNYNNNEEDEMEEGRMQKIMLIMSLVIALVYGSISAFILRSNFIAITQDDTQQLDSTKSFQSSAHVDVLADSWKFISVFSIVATFISFVLGIVSLFTEEGERMREEGNVYSFLISVTWTLLLVSALTILGNRTFGRIRSTSQTEVGFFVGTLNFFAAGALLITGLYGGFSIPFGEGNRGRGEEGSLGSLVFAFSCCAFALAYLAFASLLSRYHMSILHVNKDEIVSDYFPMHEEPASMDLTSAIFFWRKKDEKETELVDMDDKDLA